MSAEDAGKSPTQVAIEHLLSLRLRPGDNELDYSTRELLVFSVLTSSGVSGRTSTRRLSSWKR